MDPSQYDDILRRLQDKFLEIFRNLPPEIRDRVREQFRALMAALYAARNAVAAGPGAQADALRAILEALKRFLAALLEAGWSNPQVQFWIRWIEQQMARIGAGAAAETGGAAGAGAGLTAAAILLLLLAILAGAWSIYEVAKAKGLAPEPVGGPACSASNPVAKGLTASSWSIWGESRAFRNAEAKARGAAQAVPCPDAVCASGTCRGNCAILDIQYEYRFFWTRCTVTFDVHCECY